MHIDTLCKRKFHSAFCAELLLDCFSRSSDALFTPDPQQHITLMPVLEKGSAPLCTLTFTPLYCYWHTDPLLFSFCLMSGKEISFFLLSSFPDVSVMLVPWLIFLLFSLVPLFPQTLNKYWIKEPFCLRNASWELIRQAGLICLVLYLSILPVFTWALRLFSHFYLCKHILTREDNLRTQTGAISKEPWCNQLGFLQALSVSQWAGNHCFLFAFTGRP